MTKGQSVKAAKAEMLRVFEEHRQRTYKNGLDMALKNGKKVGSYATRLGRIAVSTGAFASAAEWKSHFTEPHVRSYRYVCQHCAKPVKLKRIAVNESL